jgi:hypothetical protein
MPYINNVQAKSFLAGQIVDSNPFSLDSMPNGETTLSIPFGIAMYIDGTTQGFKLPALITDVTNRMAVNVIINRNRFYSYDASLNPTITGNDRVAPGAWCAGLTLGYVAVTVEEAVNAGDPCFIRYAAGAGGTQLGAFRKTVDSTTAVAHPVWYYETSAALGTIALVRVA